MASKTLLNTLFALATDVNLSKKRRTMALDAIVQHLKESKVKVPAVVDEIREQIEFTPNGGRSSVGGDATVGPRILSLLRETDDSGYAKYSHKEIAAIVRREYPGKNTSDKSVASTKRDLPPHVKAALPLRRAKSDKVKPATIQVDLANYEFEPDEE